jgi:membrane-bound serine protease (ClpP class)
VEVSAAVTKRTQLGGYGAVSGGLALLLGGAALAFYTTGGLSPLWIGLLLAGGVALLLLEAFVIPGFGPVGVASIILLLLAAVAAIVPDGRGDAVLAGRIFATITTRHGVAALGGIGMVTGAALLAIHAPRLPVLSKLTLATPDGAALALRHPHPDIAHVGEVGEVIADLRPAGRARFGDEMVDVRTRGEYVSAGARVEVLRREGAAIIVRPLTDTQERPVTT